MGLTIKYVTLAGDNYPVVLGSNAVSRLEKETGLTLPQFGFLLASGRGGVRLMQMFLWAALEGGRLREKKRHSPWTYEEVGDLVDNTDGGMSDVWREPDDGLETKEVDGVKQKVQVRPVVDFHPVMQVLTEALQVAFPKARPEEPVPANPPVGGSPSAGTSESMPPSSQG